MEAKSATMNGKSTRSQATVGHFTADRLPASGHAVVRPIVNSQQSEKGK